MKRISIRSIALALLAASPFVFGCSTTPATGKASSNISGTIDSQSFAGPVSKITVRTGKTDKVVDVDGAGHFTATLEQGQSYQLLVGQAGGNVPIVLHRSGGRLDTTVTVSAAGAQIDLGLVTYWQNAAALPPAAKQMAALVCGDGDGEENDDGEEADGEENDDGVDCVDGIDAATGAECDGGPSANQNDGEEADNESSDGEEAEDTDCSADDAMGLPENDLPDSIGCAGGGDDHEDGEEADD